jgi:hypothetical protein
LLYNAPGFPDVLPKPGRNNPADPETHTQGVVRAGCRINGLLAEEIHYADPLFPSLLN